MPASEIHIAFQRNLFRLLLWNYAAAARLEDVSVAFRGSAQLGGKSWPRIAPGKSTHGKALEFQIAVDFILYSSLTL